MITRPLTSPLTRGNTQSFAPSTPYAPYAVTFDGTNDYLSYTASTSSDSKQFTFSFWVRRNVITQDWIFALVNNGGAGTDRRLEFFFDGGPLAVRGRSSAGTDLLEVYSSDINDTDWHHYMGSFDLSDTGKRHLYIDNVSDLATVFVYTNGTIEMGGGAGPQTYIANREAAGASTLRLNGDMAQFWFESGTYIDLSDAGNRAKFVSALVRPVDMGVDGSIPTGSSPDVYLEGVLAGWATNKGTGGGFTTNGTLTTASTSP